MFSRLQLLAAFLLSVCSVTTASAQSNCQNTPEGRVCTTQQPIINGGLVSIATQQELGLITIGGKCSGTLVNRYWVLTADHCVTSTGTPGGPSDALTNLRVTAAWTADYAIPTRLIRKFWTSQSLDVALMFLGAGDFGSNTRIQLLALNELAKGDNVVKYGRGIYGYATAGPPPVPALSDGKYRTANFSVSATSSATYTLPVNAQAQVGAGGDSGGPDIVLAPNGVGLGIAGVQSTCVATGYVAGQPLNWNWATGISSCNSAPIAGIRFDIVEITRERPVNVAPVLYESLYADPPIRSPRCLPGRQCVTP